MLLNRVWTHCRKLFFLSGSGSPGNQAQVISAEFDRDFYIATYQDVRESRIDPCEHYIQLGWKEGRDPTPWFSTEAYLHDHPDVRSAGVNPFFHYLRFGRREGRKTRHWREQFDPLVYADLNSDITFIEPTQALDHFLTRGISEGRPFSLDHRFDPVFYKRHYQDIPDLSHADAYRHWLLHGFAERRFGSERDWLRRHGLTYENVAGVFDLDRYRSLVVGEPIATVCHALDHAMCRGFIPEQALRGDTQRSAQFTAELGFACWRLGLVGEAKSLCLLALERWPDCFLAWHYLGDIFLDAKDWAPALYFLGGAERINPSFFWTQMNLATALLRMGCHESAKTHAKRASECEPGSMLPPLLIRDATLAWARSNVERGFKAAEFEQLDSSRECMNRAVACIEMAEIDRSYGVPRAKISRSRVVILADDAVPQCFRYRVENKIFQLSRQDIDVEWFSKSHVPQFEAEVPFADIAIFYRVPAFPEIVSVIRYTRELGKLSFYEIDDLIFDHQYYPEPIETYSGLISSQQYSVLAAGAELFRLAMRECDYAIASTAALAEHMRKQVRSGTAIVVPNAAGLVQERHLETPRPQLRRFKRVIEIFYSSGTLAHKSDFAWFAKCVLAEILARHTHVHLALMGTFPPLAELQAYASRVHVLSPIWDFPVYLERLREADINIAVLGPHEFNDCKSEIKWFEAALFGIPSVVSRTKTYEAAVENGKTGFLCTTADEWIEALQSLIIAPALRGEIGRNARQVVRARYNPTTVGKDLAAHLLSHLSDRQRSVSGEKTRIVIVHSFYPPQDVGGSTRVVQETVDSFVARYGSRMELLVFTTKDGDPNEYQPTEYFYNGVRVTAVTRPRDELWEWTPRDERMKKMFARYLAYHQPEFVHFHCLPRLTGAVVEAALEADIPYVVTVHDGWWLSDHQYLVDAHGRVRSGKDLTLEGMRQAGDTKESIERTAYLRGLLARAKAVIAVSKQFAQIYRDANIAGIHVVENGTISVRPVECTTEAGNHVRVGFIAGLTVHKGYELLRRIWLSTRFDHIELVLVDHEQVGRSELFHNDLTWNGNAVSFLERTRHDKVSNLYASLHVLLAPSIWPESFGLVTREAAQAGLWIIASDRGAIGDVVEEGRNGFRVDVSDARELRRVLLEIDANPARYRERTKMMPHVRTFDDQADDLIALYRSVGCLREKP
ncbi:MAG: glycosyltransferase [Rhizobiales bacterium]|nr:glycosyltransferase [Hyphomicrobiales bacterium]